MSKNGKKLLNENTIRRFMKLAEIDTLSDQFVDTLSGRYGNKGLKEGMPYQRDDEEKKEVVAEQDEEPAFDMGEEEGAEDPEAELPPEPEEAAPAAGDPEAIFTDIVDRIIAVAGEHGVDMSREGGEAEEAPEAELGGEEDLGMDMAPEEEPMMEDEEIPGVELEEEVDEDTMVAEITRRVTARLMKESRNDKVAAALAERIMSRLGKTSRRK